MVPVDDAAVSCYRNEAIGVTVEGDTAVRSLRPDRLDQIARVGRSAPRIDVATIGAGVDDIYIGSEPFEDGRSKGASRAIGSVDDDLQLTQIPGLDGRGNVGDVVPHCARRDIVDGRGGPRGVGLLGYCGFEFRLGGVVKLHSTRGEDLQTIVVEGVVGGGDHDSGKPATSRIVGDRGGGNNSEVGYVGALRTNPSRQRGQVVGS